MLHFSKSKYTLHCQCPKITWLKKYKPETETIDAATLANFAKGNEVGDLAMRLFGDYTEITSFKSDGSLDIAEMINQTKECLQNNVENICEASFSYNGLYCAVDILRKNGDKYDIYEVKSSTHPHEFVYVLDVSYQRYVLEHCGVNVGKTYIVTINNAYVRNGELDIKRLFNVTDISKVVNDEIVNVEQNLSSAEQILALTTEPQIDISCSCNTPYPCSFWKYCSRNLPSPSVFDIYRLPFKNAVQMYNDGIISFDDITSKDIYLGDKQNRQIRHGVCELKDEINIDSIKGFLKGLTYPLYFLDFETMQPIIPQFDGTRPYMQIPFQYSLHYIEEENGELHHKEFLAESGVDPRRTIAESLVKNIPDDVCILAYNKGFECGRLQELADMFPDLRNHLMSIKYNMKDLLDPFRQGYYYNRAMGGSFSIKSVLPALFPNDPELDYHNLNGVHNGSEAMTIFPQIASMPKNEQLIARQNLLKYCELDTYAMVKVWQKLVNVCK